MRTLLRTLLNIYDYLVLYLGLVWLGGACLVWTSIALIVCPLLPVRQGRTLGRYVIMAAFRLYLASLTMSRRCSFDLEALDALRDEPSLIIAPNHPCLLDAVMIISRLPNIACVMKAELMNNVFLSVGARLARYVSNDRARRMILLAIQDFDCGSHLLLFPEGARTTHDPVNRFKGSIGLIAKYARVPVQTILIETDSKFLSKGWSLFRKPSLPIHYRVRLGRRFDPPQNTKRFMAELEHYFAHELVQGSAFLPANSLSTTT